MKEEQNDVMRAAVLVVEDEIVTRRLIERALEAAGFRVVTVTSCREAEATLARQNFDAVLLDLVLPDGSGLTLCRSLRARSRVPIIIATAKGDVDDVVAGLEQGADDYVTKPLDMRSLVARVNAHLRRAGIESEPDRQRVLRIGDLVVDSGRRDAFRDGRPAGLTNKEFDLIAYLAERPARAVHKDVLFQHLWGESEERSEKILAVYIRRIRRKIEADADNPVYLRTLRGFGYALFDPKTPVPAH